MAKGGKVEQYFLKGSLEHSFLLPMSLRMCKSPQNGLILGEKGKVFL